MKDVEKKTNYEYVKSDIVDDDFILKLFKEKLFNGVINLAVESQIDQFQT